MIAEHDFELDVCGVAIRGAWLADSAAAGPLPVVVIMHGIPRARPEPGDQTYRVLARAAAEDGLLAVIFNFRGTGASAGNLSLAGWRDDCRAVIDFARALPAADPGRLGLLGFSAGGSVAIRAAAEDPGVAAVAAVSSPAEYSFLTAVMPAEKWVALFREIGLIRDPGFPPSPAEWEAEFEAAAPIRCVAALAPRPLLVMHGDEDETIPVEQAHQLYEAAGAGKKLAIIAGGKHRLRADARAVAAARYWLRRHLL